MSTLKDVGALAGVSYQTVSRVINDHPKVAPTTRRRVLEAIEQLDYQPDEAARTLRLRGQQQESLGHIRALPDGSPRETDGPQLR